MDPTRQPGVSIGQVVLEKVQFEHRGDYLAFPPKTDIEDLSVRLSFQAGLTPDKTKGVLRVRAQTPETANALYRFDLTMAALIEVKPGEANMPLERYATISGVGLLYPFLREAVANLTQRGRFGPVWLSPLNVAAAVEGAHMSAGPPKAARRRPARRVRSRK